MRVTEWILFDTLRKIAAEELGETPTDIPPGRPPISIAATIDRWPGRSSTDPATRSAYQKALYSKTKEGIA